MTVYIEYVLIDNFVIDYLLLKATFTLTRTAYKKVRLFLCAILGAAFALALPVIVLNTVILTLIKLAFGLLLVLIAATFKSAKSYYINALTFFGFTFLTGGAIIGIYSLLGLDYSGEISIAVMAVPAYLLIKAISELVSFVYKRKEVVSETYDCELTLGDTTLKLKGFFDTGNGLYDGDSPVCVCDKKTALKLLGGSFSLPEMKYISFSTVSGKDKNLSLKLDKIVIYTEDKENVYYNVTLMVAKGGVSVDYDVILHPALRGGGNEVKDNRRVKKVS